MLIASVSADGVVDDELLTVNQAPFAIDVAIVICAVEVMLMV